MFNLLGVLLMWPLADRLAAFLQRRFRTREEEIGQPRYLDANVAVEDLDPLIDGTLEGAERTRDIVDGLKRFSAPDPDLSVPFNLGEVIDKAIHWVTKAAPSGFRVACDLPADLPVAGVAGQMQQVVINLIQNAVDACQGLPAPMLTIKGRREGRRVRIAFHDNGPGIAAEHLNRVFDPFFTTKPVGSGTGLGLSISCGIVGRHGGELSVASPPGGGALFELVLPLAAE